VQYDVRRNNGLLFYFKALGLDQTSTSPTDNEEDAKMPKHPSL